MPIPWKRLLRIAAVGIMVATAVAALVWAGLLPWQQTRTGRESIAGDGPVLELRVDERIAEFYAAERDFKHPLLGAWVDARLTLNDDAERAIKMHVRGHSSARFARKSYAIDLGERIAVFPELRLRKFYLLNLAFDEHGFEMKFCGNCLAPMGLFCCQQHFVHLVLNDTYQGLYLLVERPRDAIRRQHPNTAAILRTWELGYSARWTKKEGDGRKLIERLEAIEQINDTEERRQSIESAIDVESLMRWMAFNSLVQNADSVDELFLFADRDGPAQCMGWDYDDLLSAPAHPENVREDPLTWATETQLEKALLTTPTLRDLYTKSIRQLLTTELTEQVLRDRLAGVRDDLQIMDPTEHSERQRAMDVFLQELLARRRELMVNLR